MYTSIFVNPHIEEFGDTRCHCKIWHPQSVDDERKGVYGRFSKRGSLFGYPNCEGPPKNKDPKRDHILEK